MSQLITNPPALYVAVPEVKKYIGGYRNPTKDPSAFEAANSSAYASYQNDRNSRLLSGGSKNSFDYSSMKGQQVELRTIIQNLSNTQAKTVTLRLWVEHSNGEKAVTTDGEQVFTTQEFDIPVWKEKSKFWTRVRWITRAATLIPALSTALWFTRFRRMPFCNPAIPSALRL